MALNMDVQSLFTMQSIFLVDGTKMVFIWQLAYHIIWFGILFLPINFSVHFYLFIYFVIIYKCCYMNMID